MRLWLQFLPKYIKIIILSIFIAMEYAVSIAAVAIFVTIYLLIRPKVRPKYFDVYGDDAFKKEGAEYVSALSLPKEGAKQNAKKFASIVKRVAIKLKFRKYGGFFEKFIAAENEVKSFLKADFSNLEELPSINGEPRAVKLARFCLAHSDYVFDGDRVKYVIDEQNKRRTLSFSEITAFGDCFRYVLLERMCYLYQQLDTLAKVHSLAAKYVYNPVLLSPKYKKLTRSRLFLSICAVRAGYRMEYFEKIHDETTDSLYKVLQSILATSRVVNEYDFTRYYTPLEILDKYEIFSQAAPDTKSNFLALIKQASDKENLDEFMYTIRLDKYMNSASAGHMMIKRMDLFGRRVCITNQKKDISMLATALASKHFMNLYFANNNKKRYKKSKSIANIVNNENTFEPIYKFNTINFGISTSGGKLRITPSLPSQIVAADLVFNAYGIDNELHLKRGEEKALFMGNTKLSGVEQIQLGEKPLNITLIVPRK